MTNTVLVLGSAPDALRARDFDPSLFQAIVTINNAWQIRDDWTHLVHAGDFPDSKKPVAAKGQKVLSHETYVPANNAFGGIVYSGGTMAFSTAYWVLHALNPDMVAFYGCDMVYNQKNGRSHFYGKGEADPLRVDPTLQSLEAKANRLMLLALQQNCMCINLSELPESRLTFPKLSLADLSASATKSKAQMAAAIQSQINPKARDKALLLEQELGCLIPSGDYWHHMKDLQADKLAEIDQAWLKSYKGSKEFGVAEPTLQPRTKQANFA